MTIDIALAGFIILVLLASYGIVAANTTLLNGKIFAWILGGFLIANIIFLIWCIVVSLSRLT